MKFRAQTHSTDYEWAYDVLNGLKFETFGLETGIDSKFERRYFKSNLTSKFERRKYETTSVVRSGINGKSKHTTI